MAPSTVIIKSYFCAHGTFRGAIVNCDFLIQWNLTLTDGCEHCTKASAGQRATGAYRCKFDTFWATARCARTTRGLAEIIASPPAPDISIMCHPKEPIDAMQIVQKDISENLHIRDVGLYAVKLGREDSDAPPQGGFSHAGTSNHKVDAANVFIILGFQTNLKLPTTFLLFIVWFNNTFSFSFIWTDIMLDIQYIPIYFLDKCF